MLPVALLSPASLRDWQWDLILNLAHERDVASAQPQQDKEATIDIDTLTKIHKDAAEFLTDTGLCRPIGANGVIQAVRTTWRVDYMREVLTDWESDLPARVMEKLHTSKLTAWAVILFGAVALLLSMASHTMEIWPLIKEFLLPYCR